MNNIIVAVKKFFKNKNTVTLIALIVALGGLYYVYNWRINVKTQPVVVPYASQSIGPRTYITNDMIATKKVPGGVVTQSVILNKKEIIGKYVNKDAVIPENGLFYDTAVVKWEEISNTLYSDIPNGHTIVDLKVNKNLTYGNSIYPGNYIDLYYIGPGKAGGDKRKVVGKFIESIRVLAVTDSQGQNVFETKGTPKSPSYLIFSVDDEYHILLRKALLVSGAEIFAVPRNASYSENPKETRVVSSAIREIIETKTTDVEQDNAKSNSITNGGM